MILICYFIPTLWNWQETSYVASLTPSTTWFPNMLKNEALFEEIVAQFIPLMLVFFFLKVERQFQWQLSSSVSIFHFIRREAFQDSQVKC